MKIFKYIDTFLNSITMYRLVLGMLASLSLISLLFAALGILPHGILPYLYSLFILLSVCFGSNWILAKLFKAHPTFESSLISALILFLILFPAVTLADAKILVIAAFIAMASKYLLAIRREHIFNPAAISLVILGAFGSGNVSWWIGSQSLFFFSLISGFFIIRKIRRFRMVGLFLLTHIAVAYVSGIPVSQSLLSWPIIFFGAIMLTEPFTAPSGKRGKNIYAVIVGILSALPFHVGPVYSSPELALIIGNILAFITSMKRRLDLTLVEKKEIAQSIYEFSFAVHQPLNFKPGEYLEWTLPHSNQDNRGIRRYFTLASSPTEKELKLGVKIMPIEMGKSSSFKKALLDLKIGEKIYAESLDGDFLLPKNKTEKMVFIGGGIGVTPFRSMIKYLQDKQESRDVIMFYAANSNAEIAYTDIWPADTTHYVIKSFITEEMIREKVPDFTERTFYLSGPNAMVDAYKKLLKKMGVKNSKLVSDYFPGY